MKKLALIGFLSLMTMSSFASSDFSCTAGGGLGDLFCLGAKSRAKSCAIRECKISGYPNCEVIEVKSVRTDYSTVTSCRAYATVIGSYDKRDKNN